MNQISRRTVTTTVTTVRRSTSRKRIRSRCLSGSANNINNNVDYCPSPSPSAFDAPRSKSMNVIFGKEEEDIEDGKEEEEDGATVEVDVQEKIIDLKCSGERTSKYDRTYGDINNRSCCS